MSSSTDGDWTPGKLDWRRLMLEAEDMPDPFDWMLPGAFIAAPGPLKPGEAKKQRASKGRKRASDGGKRPPEPRPSGDSSAPSVDTASGSQRPPAPTAIHREWTASPERVAALVEEFLDGFLFTPKRAEQHREIRTLDGTTLHTYAASDTSMFHESGWLEPGSPEPEALDPDEAFDFGSHLAATPGDDKYLKRRRILGSRILHDGGDGLVVVDKPLGGSAELSYEAYVELLFTRGPFSLEEADTWPVALRIDYLSHCWDELAGETLDAFAARAEHHQRRFETGISWGIFPSARHRFRALAQEAGRE